MCLTMIHFVVIYVISVQDGSQKESYWKERLYSEGQQLYQYQQHDQLPLT
jgi:hypothetical protein